jgi:hypothetical protein
MADAELIMVAKTQDITQEMNRRLSEEFQQVMTNRVAKAVVTSRDRSAPSGVLGAELAMRLASEPGILWAEKEAALPWSLMPAVFGLTKMAQSNRQPTAKEPEREWMAESLSMD